MLNPISQCVNAFVFSWKNVIFEYKIEQFSNGETSQFVLYFISCISNTAEIYFIWDLIEKKWNTWSHVETQIYINIII